MRRNFLTFLTALFLIAATLAVYWQVGDHEFIDFDDNLYVTENSHVQAGLTLKGVKWALTTTDVAYWHPVTWLSLMLDYELYGLNSRGYHLTNLLFHILSTLLLFAALKRMTGAASPLPAPLRLPAQSGTGAQVRSKAAGKHPALKFGTDAEQ